MTLEEAMELLAPFGPNCLLGICCPPEKQRALLSKHLQEQCKLSKVDADATVNWLLDRLDLAPKDSVTPVLRAAGKLAKAGTP